MSNSLVKSVDSVAQVLRDRPDLFAVAPHEVRQDRTIALVRSALFDNPVLLDCSRASLFMALKRVISLGLDLGGPLGEAYIIPYGKVATPVPGYKGLLKLAYRSRRIKAIDSAVVREDDEFRFSLGTDPGVWHVPSLRDDASTNVVAVYATAHLQGDAVLVRIMSRRDIEKHRKRFSKGGNRPDGPWSTSWDEMAMKTVLRKLFKVLPMSTNVQEMIATEEFYEAGVPQKRLRSGDEAPTGDLDTALADTGEVDDVLEALAAPEPVQDDDEPSIPW